MILTLALVLTVSPGAFGEATVVLSPAGVTVNALEAPLGRVVKQFAAVAPIDMTLVDARVQGYPVSVALENVPLAYALRATLEAAGVSFVVWGDEPPTLRVAAYPRDDSSRPAPPPPPPPPPAYSQEEYEDILGPPPGTPPAPPAQPTEEDLEILGPPPMPAPQTAPQAEPQPPEQPPPAPAVPGVADVPHTKQDEAGRKNP